MKKKKGLIIAICVAVVAIILVIFISNTASKHSEISDEEKYELVIINGIDALERGEFDLAISEFTFANELLTIDNEKKAYSLFWRGRIFYAIAKDILQEYGLDSWEYAREKSNIQYEKALADLNSAIELHQSNYQFFEWRGRIHNSLNNCILAIEDFNKAIDLIEGGNWDLYFERGDVYFWNKDYSLAIEDYEQAILALENMINSQGISTEENEKLVKRLDEIIDEKSEKEKFIEFTKNNPDVDYVQWLILDLIGL